MNEYRIKEYDGKYTIEIKIKITKTHTYYPRTKFIFWDNHQKTELVKEAWFPCDISGHRLLKLLPPCDTFSNINKAYDKIKAWERGPIYHKPE